MAWAVEHFQQVEAPLIGFVLNGVDSEDLYGYGFGQTGPDLDDGGPALIDVNGKMANAAVAPNQPVPPAAR